MRTRPSADDCMASMSSSLVMSGSFELWSQPLDQVVYCGFKIVIFAGKQSHANGADFDSGYSLPFW